MPNKTTGQLREEKRYGGDPKLWKALFGGPATRKAAHIVLTPKEEYMREAGEDTARILLEHAAAPGLREAYAPKKKKKTALQRGLERVKE